MTINYRFVAVRSNWVSVTQQHGYFCGRFYPRSLSKYSWCKNESRTTYRNVEFLVNGFLENWPKIHFFIEKLCSATKLIFDSMDKQISRIVDFGMKINQKHRKSYQCIQKKSQFSAVYSLVATLDRTSSKMLRIVT